MGRLRFHILQIMIQLIRGQRKLLSDEHPQRGDSQLFHFFINHFFLPGPVRFVKCAFLAFWAFTEFTPHKSPKQFIIQHGPVEGLILTALFCKAVCLQFKIRIVNCQHQQQQRLAGKLFCILILFREPEIFKAFFFQDVMIVFIPDIYPFCLLIIIKFQQLHYQSAGRNIRLVNQCFTAGYNDPDRAPALITALLKITHFLKKSAVYFSCRLQHFVITVKY